MWADLVKNGSSIRRGNRESYTVSNGAQCAVYGLVQMAAGDTMGLGATTGSNTSIEVVDALKTYFDGFLVSKI